MGRNEESAMFNRANVAWMLYDVGNSAYVLLVPSIAFSVYFRNRVFEGDAAADFVWGAAVSISLIVAGIIAPFLGALADHQGVRKRIFVVTALFAIFGTGSLMAVGPGDRTKGLILFILANVSLNISISIYDSFLPIVAEGRHRSLLSSIGWGVGYAGGISCLGLAFPVLRRGYDGDNHVQFRMVFGIVALFFLMFSLPAFAWLPRDHKIGTTAPIGVLPAVLSTVKSWRIHRDLAKFLLAFYFVVDAITTLVYFTSIYATTSLHLDLQDVLWLMIGTQAIAIPSTIAFGAIGSRLGVKKAFLISLGIWMLDVAFLATAESRTMLLIVMILTGLVIGSTQSLGRAWIAGLANERQTSELFGFSAITSRVSSVVGPMLFGIVAAASGSQRVAVWSLMIFLILGFALSLSVSGPIERTRGTVS